MYPVLYKGAGPGSYWHRTDARHMGFTCAATRAVTINAILSHITNYSHPSPLISFTTSFAIAKEYAVAGPSGSATRRNPGYVYEVDLSTVNNTANIIVYDPIDQISRPGICHKHNGNSRLLLGVTGIQPAMATRKVANPGGITVVPTVTQELRALVFAIRDAEVLLEKVPAPCVIHRHDVF